MLNYANWCLCWLQMYNDFDGEEIPKCFENMLKFPDHLLFKRPYISFLLEYMYNENMKKRKALLRLDMKVVTDLSAADTRARRLADMEKLSAAEIKARRAERINGKYVANGAKLQSNNNV